MWVRADILIKSGYTTLKPRYSLTYRGFFILKVTGNLKTFNIMANTKTIFYGSEKSETIDHELQCYVNNRDEIYGVIFILQG